MKEKKRRIPAASPAFFGATAAVLLLTAALRLVGIGYGLPHVYNADEPHLVNMAVSLAGSLRPFSFKYPTLWPTALAGFYGLWFVLWSGFGLFRGATDFAALYAFAPTGFYLIARGLSTACQLGAVAVVARAERSGNPARWPYGALFLAASPLLVDLGHAAKPDSLMVLLVAGAFAAALRFQSGGRRGWLLTSAFLAGLACSAQYTAAPAGLAVPLAWLLCDDGPAPLSWLVQAGLVSVGGFLIGTPYALLDHARFLEDWRDNGARETFAPHGPVETARLVARNIWLFGGEGSLGGAGALLGLAALGRKNWRRGLLLSVPVLAYVAALAPYLDGSNARYLLGAFPALALLAGEGFSLLAGTPRWRRVLLGLLAVAPGLWLCARYDRDLLLPDTRAQATQWLAANVPAGSTLLLDQPHAGPFAIMTKEQCAELAERAARNGSPRARLYRAMAAKHPGGGYKIYRIQRSARDLWSAPRQVALSQADGDFLDVRPGLDPVRAVRVDDVITSSFGADPRRTREFATFFDELAAQADLVREFPSEPGRTTGPWLRVYRLRR
ncbi:MAG: glycosyltransferase family 39 protein [Elusimicrobia bacterium]|nr:glycosyltransferase family 39 protein [Elusimicrobiota bacterium]